MLERVDEVMGEEPQCQMSFSKRAISEVAA
jgi:hypothetical protein